VGKKLLEDFNLLISAPRGRERAACFEIARLLRKAGDESTRTERTHVPGMVVARTSLAPRDAISALRSILNQEPWKFRSVLKVVPIDITIPTDLGKIQDAADSLFNGIEEGETFRVTVEKRGHELSSAQIIEAVASAIDRKVDLERPDKIALVEVIGETTSLSLISPGDILAVVVEKRSL
jgi:tRNA(Ser,Leu) C12 N-acetylase TAN1